MKSDVLKQHAEPALAAREAHDLVLDVLPVVDEHRELPQELEADRAKAHVERLQNTPANQLRARNTSQRTRTRR